MREKYYSIRLFIGWECGPSKFGNESGSLQDSPILL